MVKRRFVVAFGSETGTAEEVAERIWREGRLRNFTGPLLPMNDFSIKDLREEPVVVFVCSTTGQGEEPYNMKSFWKLLLWKILPPEFLENVRFAVLGLGDSSYAKFNFVAKRLARRLQQLGGQMLLRTGLADDQHDLGADAVIEPWIRNLWEVMDVLYPPLKGVAHVATATLCPPRWRVMVSPPGVVAETASWSDFTPVPVMENTRTTAPSHFQFHRYMQHDENTARKFSLARSCKATLDARSSVTLVSSALISLICGTYLEDVRLIKLQAPDVSYQPGDVLMVQPCNLPLSVELLLEQLSANTTAALGPDSILQVEAAHDEMPVPQFLSHPITLRQCVEQYWDLSRTPQRYVFSLLAQFTTSDLERDKCLELNSTQGQEELYSYCHRPRRTMLEVLADFPHATPNIPIDYWFELLRPIKPRAFSIASSPAVHAGEVHLLAAVVKYHTMLVAPRLGLCSNWLAGLSVGDSVPVKVRKGSFKFPPQLESPVVMIGPGTGVAPFRSFVQECAARGIASSKALCLFFGCRNKEGDFHFQAEWEHLQENGELTLFCAFSRDHEHKVYVQHVMEEQAVLLRQCIVDHSGSIFLAGSSKNMPAGVQEALADTVLVREAGMSRQEALDFLASLEKSGRFQSETWS